MVKGKKIGIVVARFNESVTRRLLDGCLKELARRGVKRNQTVVLEVPGSFEIPLAALRLAKKKNIAAVICLGSVIRGETLHFELVAHNAAQGIAQVALKAEKPVIFCVLATETIDQAYQRSQKKGDNKGKDAARDCLDMIQVFNSI